MGVAGAAVALGTATIGAAGSIGGAALSGGGGGATHSFTQGGVPASDPLIGALSLDAMIQLGVAPSASQLQEQSPLMQAMSRLQSVRPMSGDQVNDILYSMNRLLGGTQGHQADPASGFPNTVRGETELGFLNDQSRQELERLATAAGFTLEELIEQEKGFRSTFGQRLSSLQNRAAQQAQATGAIERNLARIIGDLPDASATGIRELAERERGILDENINRVADEQRLDLLRAGNFGNFNAGRPIGDLEESRFRSLRDSDLSALARAVSQIGAQQEASAGNLSLLQTERNRRDALASNLGAMRQRTASNPGAITTPRSQNSALGQGISQALPTALAAGRAGYDIFKGIQQSRPATPATAGIDTAAFPTLYGNPFGG